MSKTPKATPATAATTATAAAPDAAATTNAAPAGATTETGNASQPDAPGTSTQAGEGPTAQPPADGAAVTTQTTEEAAPPVAPKLLRQVARQVLNFATVQMETKHEVIEEDLPADAPESLTLACPFGFYEDGGNYRNWSANQVITDTQEMMELIMRGAVFLPDPEPAADGV